MKCPVCDVELKIYVRQSIEVDYCPQCRGVWLDRGELDKIIEASQEENSRSFNAPQTVGPVAAPPSGQPVYQQQPSYKRYDDDDDEDERYRHRGDYEPRQDKYGRRRKRGVLGDIFDIFD